MKILNDYKAILIGASAGSLKIITNILTALPKDFTIPILIVQHRRNGADGIMAELLNDHSQLRVKEADEKEKIRAGTVYLAPPNYHLLLEPDLTLTLTIDERVNYARPSIDVLFETAAESCKEKIIGIICSGGNTDGAFGLQQIKLNKGITIVQNPETAEVKSMPLAAIQAANPDYILSPEEISSLLLTIHENQKSHEFEY